MPKVQETNAMKNVSRQTSLDSSTSSSTSMATATTTTPADAESSQEPTPIPTSPSPTAVNQGKDEMTTSSTNSGVRRSHRIKQKPQEAKTIVNRDNKDRLSGCGGNNDTTAPPLISMEEQLIELANIDNINDKFLRSEGLLNTFQMISENFYRCKRQVSHEKAEMQCDCFLTNGDEEEEARGDLRCGARCINRMLLIECGPLCANGDRCTNKRFQNRHFWPCRVFRTEKKGYGLTTDMKLNRGEFIMECIGEVIDSKQFERRQYLYSLQDKNRHYYFMALRGGNEAIIDAAKMGNISRFINHSCDPNAETQKWIVNGELRIGFFSRRTIMPNEEITFDYQYQRYGREAQRCYCEAANCRGWIGKPHEQQHNNESETCEDDDDDAGDANVLADESSLNQHKKIYFKLKEPKTKSLKAATTTTSSSSKTRKRKQLKANTKKLSQLQLQSSTQRSAKELENFIDQQLEDPDVLEELKLLNKSGLQTQVDTLHFSRCMVRAKLPQTRINLLRMLANGEVSCRRLFLDYHGLRLLHAWMKECGENRELRSALIEGLESLPIPNRTTLHVSRVYQCVVAWSSLASSALPPSPTTTPPPSAPPSTSTPLQQLEEAEGQVEGTNETIDPLLKRMKALLLKWDALPDAFRIPKREPVEQMQKPELVDDHGSYSATVAAAAPERNRYQNQNRFRHDNTSNRYTRPKSNYRRRYDRPKRPISKELRREMFERKVAQDVAKKRGGGGSGGLGGDYGEHEVRCEFFGADPRTTDPNALPFYHNTETDEWFNSEDVRVAPPLRCGGNDADIGVDKCVYMPPASVLESLAPAWHWNVTPTGDIYYYHLRDRIPQWEPPTQQQLKQSLFDDDDDEDDGGWEGQGEEIPVESSTSINPNASSLMVEIDAEHVASLSEKELEEYIEDKVRERRELRRRRLVSVRFISPGREEDRRCTESSKYKENKEKLRQRKDHPHDVAATDDNTSSSNPLPIQRHLTAADENINPNPNTTTTSSSTRISSNTRSLPFIDAIVDEFELLNIRRQRQQQHLSPSTKTKSNRQLTMPPLPSSAATAPSLSITTGGGGDSGVDREERRKRSSSGGRNATDKFYYEISGHVAEFLRPFCKQSCQLGRITCDEDYKFLIKRLSHYITQKEMRCCEASGNSLACTESVKHKSFDFVNQYMRKKGKVYKRPVDDSKI